jgi:hypothetical protein
MRINHMRSKSGNAVTLLAVLSTVQAFMGQAAAGPDRTLGAAIMAAEVAADGSPIDGTGVFESSYNEMTNRYVVKFNRRLTGCASTVSPWVINAEQLETLTLVANHTAGTAKDEIWVSIKKANGDGLQYPFRLIVVCWR